MIKMYKDLYVIILSGFRMVKADISYMCGLLLLLLFFGSRIADTIVVSNIIIINSDININARKSIYRLYYFYSLSYIRFDR